MEWDRCYMLLSRCICKISTDIILHCKRVQDYVKSIIKGEQNVLKPKETLQKYHQDSKWCIHNVWTISTTQQGLVIVNFQTTYGLISIDQWITLNDWDFSLINVNQSYLCDSQTAVKKGRSNVRIQLTKVEERLTCECMGTLLFNGWINDLNWYILW